MRAEPSTNQVSVTCFSPNKLTEMNRSNRDRVPSYHHSLRSSKTEGHSPYEETLRSNHSIRSSSSKKPENKPLYSTSSSPSSLRSLVHKLSNSTSPQASKTIKRHSSPTGDKFRGRSPSPSVAEIPDNRTTDDILQFLESDKCQRDEPEAETREGGSTPDDPFMAVYENSDVLSSIWDEPKTPLHKNAKIFPVEDPIVVEDMHPTTPMMTTIPSEECESDVDLSPLVSSCSSEALMDPDERHSKLQVPALNHGELNTLNGKPRVSVQPNFENDTNDLNKDIQGHAEFSEMPKCDSSLVNSSSKTPVMDVKSEINQPKETESVITSRMEHSVEHSGSKMIQLQHNVQESSIRDTYDGMKSMVNDTHFTELQRIPCSIEKVMKPQDIQSSYEPTAAPANDCFSPQLSDMDMARLLQERDQIKEHYEKLDHEIFSTIKQQYNLISQQYHIVKREKEAALEKINHLETEVERLHQRLMISKGK
jgi:hypothetical protein